MTKKYRLLIISDNETSLQMIRNIVRHHAKLKHELASSGAEGLSLIKENEPYHVIVSDLVGTSCSTAQVLTLAKEKSEETRLLVVSGFGDHGEIINAINTGVYAYLHKPFRPEELNLMLNNVTLHFQHLLETAELKEEITLLEVTAQEKFFRFGELERKLVALKGELKHFRPEAGQTDLEKALASAARERTGQPQSYRIFQELDNLKSLREEKKITDDEYHEFRKSVLDKTYQTS